MERVGMLIKFERVPLKNDQVEFRGGFYYTPCGPSLEELQVDLTNGKAVVCC